MNHNHDEYKIPNCPICKIKCGRLLNHIRKFHPEVDLSNDGYNYYFTYIAPEESKVCKYCGKPRKMVPGRINRCFDTCGSKECKSVFSALGSKTQIETEGKVLWVEKRSVRLHKLYPKHNSQIWIDINKNMVAFRRKHKMRSPQELVLFNELTKNNIIVKPDDYRFYHSRSKKHELNVILDFTIASIKLNIEVDGSCHARKADKDTRRDQLLNSIGWTVLRFTNEQIDNDLDEVIDLIKDKITYLTSTTRT